MPGVTSSRRRWLELVFLHLACHRRPWPDNAHLATQHVEELRQLIQGILAQEAAQPRNARIVGRS